MAVEILGRTFRLKANMAPEALHAVARLVDEQLVEMQRAFPASPFADLAILVALNLACECLESKEDYQQLQADIEQRSRQLLQKLETHESHFLPGP